MVGNAEREAASRRRGEQRLGVVVARLREHLCGRTVLDDATVRDAQARLLARIDGTADVIRPAFPHAADSDTGRWQTKPGGAWTDGFWVGLCWLAYRLTGADR